MLGRSSLPLVLLLGLVALVFAGDAAIQLSPRCGALTSSSFDEKEVADLIAHIMGITPLHAKSSRINFPVTDIFSHPNSNLIVAVDGVGIDTLNRLNAGSLQFFSAQPNEKALLKQETATSRSSLASIMTLVSGELPTAHGIYGRTWVGSANAEELSAFTTTQSSVPTIADVLLNTFPESNVIAVSSDRQFASALGPHPQQAGNAHVVFWDTSLSAFVNSVGEQQLSRQQVIAAIQQLDAAGGQLEVLGESSVRFTLNSRVDVSFDLAQPQDFALFAELVALSTLVPSLVSQRVVAPRSCDLISVGIHSVRSLEERYGPGSAQVVASLYLLDSNLAQLSSALDGTYADQTTRQTLLLGTSVLAGNHAARSTRAVLDDDFSLLSSSNTTYTPQQVADYQISIWGSVFAVVAFVVPVWAFLNMDTSSDSILYRVAGPRLS